MNAPTRTSRFLRLLAAATALSSAAGCGSSTDAEVTDTTSSSLTRVCQDGEVVQGIDVSKWQGTVDWNKVATADIKFAFARTNDGTYIDPDFADNWQGMKNAGLIRGAYQFFRDSLPAKTQADTMLKMMGPLADDDLPPVLDVENASLSDVPIATTHAIIKEWIAYMQEKTGRVPIVYTGSYFWRDDIKSLDITPVPLWIAHYTDQKYCPFTPEPWKKWTFHQWGVTDKGTVAGVNARIDRDVFNGDLAALKQFVKNSHIVKGDGGAGADAGTDAPTRTDADAGATSLDDGGRGGDSASASTGDGGRTPPPEAGYGEVAQASGSCSVAAADVGTSGLPRYSPLVLALLLSRRRRAPGQAGRP